MNKLINGNKQTNKQTRYPNSWPRSLDRFIILHYKNNKKNNRRQRRLNIHRDDQRSVWIVSRSRISVTSRFLNHHNIHAHARHSELLTSPTAIVHDLYKTSKHTLQLYACKYTEVFVHEPIIFWPLPNRFPSS